MKFQIDKQSLSDGLAKVQGIIGKRMGSIISHVLLSVESNQLTIYALGESDNFFRLITKIAVNSEEEGKICVGGKQFFQIVQRCPSGTIQLTAKLSGKPQLALRIRDTEFNIEECKRAEDFPPFETVQDVISTIELASEDLRRIIDETQFSVADADRMQLNGMKFERSETGLRLVSTDGNRLSWSEAEYEGELDFEIDLIFKRMLLPKNGMKEVRKLCGDTQDNWTVSFGEREVSFSNQDTTFIVAWVAAQFPNYQRIISRIVSINQAVIPRRELIDAFRRAELVVRDIPSVKFTLDSGAALRLTAKNPDIGKFEEGLDIEYKGSKMEIAFNLKYFQEVLSALQNVEHIELNLSDNEIEPCLIRVPTRENCQFVIMPMRLTQGM